MQHVTEVTHPLVQHKLSIIRRSDTKPNIFRAIVKEISVLLGYEATKDLELSTMKIQTPVSPMDAPVLKNCEPAIVSILRAGNGMLDGVMELMPTAPIGFIGLFRKPDTTIEEYYKNLPANIHEKHVIVVDPMLATGHSAAVAISRIKEENPQSIKFLCLLAAPEGIEYMRKHHPDVPIITASIDEKLNEKSYIVPGLGDAGDRIYGNI